jgi:hypothetical protein
MNTVHDRHHLIGILAAGAALTGLAAVATQLPPQRTVAGSRVTQATREPALP